MQNLMTYLIAFFASGALSSALGTTAKVGESCYTDSVCETFCCDNDGNYHVEGECIALEESDRCSKRKLQYNIALWLIILGMVAATVIFGLKKKRENDREQERLTKLKIDSMKEEQERQAKEENPFTVILGRK